MDGPNGSGKTTLLRILLGDIEADKGEVVWHKLSKPRYLPQSSILFNEEMKVYQLFDKELWEKARTLLGCLKVRGDNFFKKLRELSEGQKRKVELVKIILDEPNVLILDEPTTHLDYYTVELLEKALLEFKGTLILVSHDRYLVERVCERRVHLPNQFINKTAYE
ncbi:MAG TPA: ABC-F family ATP-binding cassette domain-containing protein [candidate division WOR-3 bacterium]|uniref:ABC-F family ATP-binding cassette domain-containing protein n=1 Tax=candidate division WOR-3 bacterium TaxID=2052148 RepID=A0A7C5DAS3_UNCW3|nr:ABC-F family ATP-binding cassette domain-containing protein [candidate division WOR-3 bacterium]